MKEKQSRNQSIHIRLSVEEKEKLDYLKKEKDLDASKMFRNLIEKMYIHYKEDLTSNIL